MDYYRNVIDDLVRMEEWDTAWKLIDSISPHIPKTLLGYDLLQYLNHKSKRYLEAIRLGEIAMGSTLNLETKSSIRFNLSKSYINANLPEKAVRCLEINISLGKAEGQNLDLAVALYASGKKDEAAKVLEECLEHPFEDPNNNLIAKFNYGSHLIRMGDFKLGMEYTCSGRNLSVWGHKHYKFLIKKWDGIPRIGKRILVVGEGGIGDEMLNSRFGKNLNDMGMIPSFASAHNMSSVYSRMPFEKVINFEKFTSNIDTTGYDYWTPAMDLPYTLGIEQEDLWKGAYLTEDPSKKIKWEKYFNKHKKTINIGVRWGGNPLYEQDLHRTVPVKQLYDSLVSIPNVKLFSLQKDASKEEMEYCKNMVDLDSQLEDFDDTISVIENLDFVVSSCTSVAHVSGSLDKKTFILTPIMCYYVWAEEKKHSSWYSNNVTLVRQTKVRDWTDPINQVEKYIRDLI